LLRSRSILFGKLLASLAFVMLLIIATLPLAGVSFLLGGVEPWEVARGTAMVIVVAAFLACLSLWCSSVVRRTQGATVLAYGMVLALVLGTWVVYGAQAAFSRGESVRNLAVLQFNPLMAVADVLDDSADITNGGSGFSPFTPMQALLRERQNRTPQARSGAGFQAVGGQVVEQQPQKPRKLGLDRPPFFAYSLLLFAGLSAGSLWLASRRLSVPKPAP
jgi:ABC-type transport system involved in multi-copper enzyme maturation permease subunit